MRLTKPSRLKFHLRFETAPDLISGIELTTNGQKVAWSIADYLASLEKGVEELLKVKDEQISKTSSDLTPKIAKRAYELYEQQGHKSNSQFQNWSQAEQEIRKLGRTLNLNQKLRSNLRMKPKLNLKPEGRG